MARPRKYFNERRQTGITIDAKILNAAIEAGIPINQTCEDSLLKALHPALLTQRLEAQREQIEKVITATQEREQTAQKERERHIEEFKQLGQHIIEDELKLAYWSRQTGLSRAELIALKSGEIDNQQHVSD